MSAKKTDFLSLLLAAVASSLLPIVKQERKVFERREGEEKKRMSVCLIDLSRMMVRSLFSNQNVCVYLSLVSFHLRLVEAPLKSIEHGQQPSLVVLCERDEAATF